jgi:hypothetical protein
VACKEEQQFACKPSKTGQVNGMVSDTTCYVTKRRDNASPEARRYLAQGPGATGPASSGFHSNATKYPAEGSCPRAVRADSYPSRGV